ncbi:MAG: DUF5946 family protein [Chloroflexota bacterium]
MNQKTSVQENYNELTYYTMNHPDPSFIHQHVVDAFCAQYADERTKPIAITFALIGLYLYLEKNSSGKQVQQAHVILARHRKQWPKFNLPAYSGNITASDVLKAPPGPERDKMIRKWCDSVWDAYKGNHQKVAALVQSELLEKKK